MQPTTPHHDGEVDWSLGAMFVTMTLAVVFLVSQLA